MAKDTANYQGEEKRTTYDMNYFIRGGVERRNYYKVVPVSTEKS